MAGIPPGYGSALASMMGKPSTPPMPAAPSGPTPMAPGAAPPIGSATQAPPPMNVGKIPTGGGSVEPKVAAGTAIQNIRELKSHFPESAAELDAMIAQIRSYAAGSSDLKKPDAGDGPPVG